jgi:signal transduction histidine kinase
MKLSEKIIISYVFVLALIIILEVINKTFSGYIRKDSERLNRSEEILSKSASIQKSIANMESDFRGYFLVGDSSLATRFYISSAHFEDTYKSISPEKMEDSSQAGLYRQLGRMVRNWKDTILIPVIIARQDYLINTNQRNQLNYERLYHKAIENQLDASMLKNITNRFNVFDERERMALDHNRRELEVSLSRNDTTSLVMALFILIVGIGITFSTARNITTRMNTMIEQAENISLGRYSDKIDDRGSDEMSRLAGALNRMTTSLEANFIKLEQSNLELKSSNRDLEQFIYSVSHDLKEPVRMVSIYTQMLASTAGTNLNSTSIEYINFATEGATRIIKLLDGLLSYLNISRFESNPEIVDIQNIINDSMKGLKDKIQESGARINIAIMPELEGNVKQLELLFCNLIDNAINFRSRKKPVIDIEVKWEYNMWIFSVKDNGIGIDRQYFEKIFIIFQRLNDRNQASGSGVGLTICKKIVELHHGEIWVNSEPGKGTTVFFSLPGFQQQRIINNEA